jgi:hypothetical protein
VLAAAGYQVVDAGATVFVYARAPIDDEWRFVTRLAGAGVLALPSALFHEPGYFRLALNVSRPDLEHVADALAEVAELVTACV